MLWKFSGGKDVFCSKFPVFMDGHFQKGAFILPISHAGLMLQRLSGQTHIVSTGYCVINSKGEKFSDVQCSDVRFRTLSQKEIADYLSTKESLDKAGAYAVQGAGAALVASVSGSISNIIGLPVEEVLCHARRLLEHT